jgi:hypothetical protein
MMAVIEDHIKKEPYKIKELEEIFGKPVIKIVSDIPYADLVVNSSFEFQLYR